MHAQNTCTCKEGAGGVHRRDERSHPHLLAVVVVLLLLLPLLLLLLLLLLALLLLALFGIFLVPACQLLRP